jgi:phage tail-like protein
VTVSTYADQELRTDEEIRELPENLWQRSYAVTGPGQPPPGTQATAKLPRDSLVQSQPGRYLWLRVRLAADGYATPLVRAIRVHYPRDSYLSYLPAVYQADDESRWFLERFLSIFQTEWDDLERKVEDLPALFDPKAVQAGAALEYLAGWLALTPEGGWTPEQNRRLLAAAPKIYPRRGTVDGLRDQLRVYLKELAGLEPGDHTDHPQILEAFRTRAHLLLSVGGLAELGGAVPLWSRSVVARLQLGVFAREGEARLVSTGDPQHEVFQETAHRFMVFVPAAWVRTADDERLVRRILDTEKPAHTGYELCLIEPRFRVGVQSTVGLDTVVGGYPRARLACRHDLDTRPCLPPRHRLGYDTVLGCAGWRRGVRLGPHTPEQPARGQRVGAAPPLA